MRRKLSFVTCVMALLLGETPGAPAQTLAVPTAVVVNPVTNKVYFTQSTVSNNVVTVLDAANTTTTSILTGGVTPSAIAVNPATSGGTYFVGASSREE
jgi:DNA-binding beta-propeller fold protein YncE